MNRRRFVAALGASIGLAGCSETGSSPTTDDDVTPVPAPSVGGSTTTEEKRTPQEPLERPFTVGEPVGEINPLSVVLANETSTERTVELRLVNEHDGDTMVDETVTVTDELRGKIHTPSDYKIVAALPETGAEVVETVEREQFDVCNDYRTRVTVDQGEALSAQTVTTEMACQSVVLDPFTIGESVGDINPLGVTVRNEGTSRRTAHVQITDTETEETLLDTTYTLTAKGSVSGEIRRPGAYEIRVSLPESGSEAVETIDEELFDTCNGYSTTVRISGSGELSSRTVSTLIACGVTVTTAGPE